MFRRTFLWRQQEMLAYCGFAAAEGEFRNEKSCALVGGFGSDPRM